MRRSADAELRKEIEELKRRVHELEARPPEIRTIGPVHPSISDPHGEWGPRPWWGVLPPLPPYEPGIGMHAHTFGVS